MIGSLLVLNQSTSALSQELASSQQTAAHGNHKGSQWSTPQTFLESWRDTWSSWTPEHGAAQPLTCGTGSASLLTASRSKLYIYSMMMIANLRHHIYRSMKCRGIYAAEVAYRGYEVIISFHFSSILHMLEIHVILNFLWLHNQRTIYKTTHTSHLSTSVPGCSLPRYPERNCVSVCSNTDISSCCRVDYRWNMKPYLLATLGALYVRIVQHSKGLANEVISASE